MTYCKVFTSVAAIASLALLVGCGGSERSGAAHGSANHTGEALALAETSKSNKSKEQFDVQKSESEWRKELTDQQFYVLRQAGTEKPFTGQYVHEKTPGVYTCAGCGQPLFDSDTKFESGSGWPSFYDVKDKGNVMLREDNSMGTTRTEIVCNRCGGHLGHVFQDAHDQPTGLRYCINSAALELEPENENQNNDKQQ
jgi:peptide-methionine (R)-S-oxide reductase